MIVASDEVPMEERNRVRGVAHEMNVARIAVLGVPDQPGVAAAIFEPLGREGISVDVIVQNVSTDGTTDLTFTTAETELKQAVQLVRAAATTVGAREVKHEGGVAKVSIVGTGMLGTPGIAGRMFRTLADARVNIEMISTSEIRITCLVDRAAAEKAVRALHKAFELDRDSEPAAL
jgi:aspartate kinase